MHNISSYSFSYLDQLSPSEVFQVLTPAAKLFNGKYLETLRIIFTGSSPYKYVTLQIPDPYSEQNRPHFNDQSLKVYQTLAQQFKDITQRTERFDPPPGESYPLIESIAHLFLQCIDHAHQSPLEPSSQFLIITPPIPPEQAETVFKNLSFHATSTRVSAIEQAPHTSQSNQFRYIFHILHDPKRKSAFSSLAASQLKEKYSILTSYTLDERTLFLPPDTPPPNEDKFREFTHFIDSAPLFFNPTETPTPISPLLAAFLQYPQIPEDPQSPINIEFLLLSRLTFYSQEYFLSRKVKDISFSFIDLKESSAGLDQLHLAIENSEPYIGYRLELRSARHMEKVTVERLLEQKARLEYNLAYIQSITRPRPILLRFTPSQLPALAAEIRSFPMQVIYDGAIKYGFQAAQAEPGGYHFLFLHPAQAARLEIDPLPLLKDLDTPHMRFYPDPFWAKHYIDDSQNETDTPLIFVPEGTSLFPSIHHWKKENLNQFLRETMTHWFHDRLNGQSIPQNPLYVFDGEPHPRSPIHIFILDRSRFEPLHTRLGWINDNLIVHQTLERESIIKDMAKDITWSELAQKIKSNMELVRRDFSDTVLSANQNIAQVTTDMTKILSSEIDRVVSETFRMSQKIRRMDERLREWDLILDDMENTLEEIRREKQSLSFYKNQSTNEFWRMEKEVETELKQAELRRMELEKNIETEITAIVNTVSRLKARLKTVKL